MLCEPGLSSVEGVLVMVLYCSDLNLGRDRLSEGLKIVETKPCCVGEGVVVVVMVVVVVVSGFDLVLDDVGGVVADVDNVTLDFAEVLPEIEFTAFDSPRAGFIRREAFSSI